MDMFQTGVNKIPETLTAVGGGTKYPNLQGFFKRGVKMKIKHQSIKLNSSIQLKNINQWIKYSNRAHDNRF